MQILVSVLYYICLRHRARASPVTDVAPDDLSEAVTPKEAAQHHARLPLAPLELFCHGDRTYWHGHAGTVQQTGAQQKHYGPYPRYRPVGKAEMMTKDVLAFKRVQKGIEPLS